MATLTIASPETPARFTTITLGPDLNELPQQKIGRIGSGKPTIFIFNNSGIRARLSELFAIEAKRLEMGQPKQNMIAYKIAICDSGGQPVEITDEEGSSYTEKGVIVLSDESYGPGGNKVQGLTMTFYPCSYIRYYGEAEGRAF